MVSMKFTSLLLGLFLSLAYAHQVIGTHVTVDRAVIGVNKELQREDKMSLLETRNKLPGGRKMMVKEEKREPRSTLNTGKAKSTSWKPTGSLNYSITNDKDGNNKKVKTSPPNSFSSHGTATPPKAFSESSQPSDAMDTEKLLEATGEIYNMLSKDYQTKARRRPPINNHAQLDEIDEP